MNGQELINFIENNPQFQFLHIGFLLMELLRRGVINPSDIIDAHTQQMREEYHKMESHFEDSCISATQLFELDLKGDDYENAKKRFFYNASFSKRMPDISENKLSEEDRKYWSDFFENTYGFSPEKKINYGNSN